MTSRPPRCTPRSAPLLLPQPPPISRSDAQFLEEGMEFVWGSEGIRLAELNDLFQRVGWRAGTGVFFGTSQVSSC